MLEFIYVVRHGFRANWSVDPTNGTYSISIPTPTGIPADPPLSSKGNYQAEELARHLALVDPSIDFVVSSPYYRCLQTIAPFVKLVNGNETLHVPKKFDKIVADSGFGEWYGSAPFEHPTHAPLDTLQTLFPELPLDKEFISEVKPTRYGESLDMLHNRVAAAVEALVRRADQEGMKSVLICTHAAIVIALGRVLTGNMPEDVSVEDFGAFTCGLSVYRRRGAKNLSVGGENRADDNNKNISDWRGSGVASGWICYRDSDCSFLSGGPERGWRFSGDEAFKGASDSRDQNTNTDAGVELGVVVERREMSIQSKSSPESRL